MSQDNEEDLSFYRQALRQVRPSENVDLLNNRLRAVRTAEEKERKNLNQLAYRATEPESTGYSRIKRDLHGALVETLNPQAVARATVEQVKEAISEFVERSLRNAAFPLSVDERERLEEDLLYELLGMGPLTPLMLDPTISDILVNGSKSVFVERKGRLERTSITFHDDEHLMSVVERILSHSQRRVDEHTPMADARLPDGSRVNVIIPPLSTHGPLISIRRFAVKRFTLDSLVAAGALTKNAAEFMKLAVRGKLNIVVSGGTGSGKTTFLNSIAEHIPPGERVITIEDTAELRLPHEHLVSLEARPANLEGIGEVSIRALLRNTLRMRPDRIIVGESRGAEALDMMQAMNTGHEGSITTIHANSPREALTRMETMMLMADVDLPARFLREQIGTALHLIVQLARLPEGKRMVVKITEVAGLDNGVVLTQDLYEAKREADGRMQMRALGVVPSFKDLLFQNGVALPEQLFAINP